MGWKWDENRMKMGWKWDERWSKGKSIASWNTLLYILDYIIILDAILLGSRESQTNQKYDSRWWRVKENKHMQNIFQMDW
jgi:hypothetical protein